MIVTIKDVAKLANVSPSTVSRVIADSPRISESTKTKVREAMKELGYHPNFIARSLANSSTQAIGLVMPSSADKVFQNPFFPNVMRGISKAAHIKDYTLSMTTGESEAEIYEGVVKMVQGRRVDGVILLYSRLNDKIQRYLTDLAFPFVVVGKPSRSEGQVTYVDNDNVGAMREVTDYLISLGHQRIAFVGGNLDLVVTIDRLQGYRQALEEAHIPYREEYIVHEEFIQEGGREAVMALMSLDEPPTALVVTDDLMALGVLQMLDEMGKSVPDDISVASFNNLLLAEMARPTLTTVDIQIFQLGYEACKALIDQVESPSPVAKRIIVPYRLIKRQSCK